MKKIKLKSNKKSRGLTKTFAFGGYDHETPEKALMDSMQQTMQVTQDTEDQFKNRKKFTAGLVGVGNFLKENASLFGGGAVSGISDAVSTGLEETGIPLKSAPAYQPPNEGGMELIQGSIDNGFANTMFAPYIAALGGEVPPINEEMLMQMIQQMGQGGQEGAGVPVEVEGNEMGETPDGQLLDFQGPSHEEGGIPVDLPSGTKIYSDRVAIDGKTMAQRKKARERKINALQKKADKGDKVAKDTLERYMMTLQKEEELDMNIQQMLNEADATPEFRNGGRVKYEVGTDAFGVPYEKPWWSSSPQESIGLEPSGYKLEDGLKSNNELSYKPPIFNREAAAIDDANPATGAKPPLGGKLKNYLVDNKDSIGNGLAGITPAIGDAMGIIGNYKQGQAHQKALEDYLRNMTPNTNEFKNFGKEGLKTLDNSKQFARQMGEVQRNEIELARHAATAQNRQTARGVNTMRALDLASQVRANRLDMESYAKEAAQLQAILNQEATMKNNIDDMVMSGEDARLMRDRDDRVNVNNMQLRSNLSKAKALSETGKSVNDIVERTAYLNALNTLSPDLKILLMGNMSQKYKLTPEQIEAYQKVLAKEKEKGGSE